MNLTYSAIRGNFQADFNKLQRPIAVAAVAALKDAAKAVKDESRAELLAAGIRRDARAMRSRVLPKGEPTINCSAEFWLRPAYLDVFETGRSISGSPYLWLPTDNVPAGDRGRKLTPKQYIQRIGPLHSVKSARTPMLVGKGTSSTIARATNKAVRFRKKAVTAGRLRGTINVPLFIGVSSINIRKRLDLAGVVRRVGERIGEFYLKNINRAENGR